MPKLTTVLPPQVDLQLRLPSRTRKKKYISRGRIIAPNHGSVFLQYGCLLIAAKRSSCFVSAVRNIFLEVESLLQIVEAYLSNLA
eukprot:scaffold2637_cov153-Cylindrotheca_fusiformis.AAC.3